MSSVLLLVGKITNMKRFQEMSRTSCYVVVKPDHDQTVCTTGHESQVRQVTQTLANLTDYLTSQSDKS